MMVNVTKMHLCRKIELERKTGEIALGMVYGLWRYQRALIYMYILSYFKVGFCS